MSKKKKEKSSKPIVNKELNGFEIKINSLGEINSSIEIEKINNFLNRELEDKKLTDREDYTKIRKGNKKGSKTGGSK